MRKNLLMTCGLMMLSLAVFATPTKVKVTMNATSTTMTLVDKDGNPVEVGTPSSAKAYEFEVEPGKYTLTGYATDKTVNGTIVLNIVEPQGSVFDPDLDDQYKDGIDDVNQFTVITCTAYVTNKHEDNTNWTIDDGDYSFSVKVNTREGEKIESEYGRSKDKGRYTFLALNGNSYSVSFTPSEQHQAEGYMTLYRGGTLTANVNVNGAIPLGGEFSVELPAEAGLELGMKFTHFTDYTIVDPLRKETSENGVKYVYQLANGQIYNYRTWMKDGLTNAGYFTMNVNDVTKCPVLKFTEADYKAHDPKAINHSVQSNNGYETGDIFLNINPKGLLKLKPGDEFLVHAMRVWEITDNSTNNYFFEPDFHYMVLDEKFQPSNSVIDIENCSDNNTSAWSRIKAKGTGTAIVLVTYDGINLNYYNNADKKDYLGGSYWGAIWPENTGVFIVTVGQPDSTVEPNMTINEQYNMDVLRLAGKFVDAEHDVFYYLDSEDHFTYTFTPENIASIEIASPLVSETAATYSAFSAEGVVKNADGSYSVNLKKGRNIIRLTDAGGNATYQIMSAKPCHREITNASRTNSKIFQPGDQVKIQYSGLFHPANKIAGIYNMSAYVTYNGVPNGSSLILGSGQYTFGSAPSAQAVIVEIPADHDVTETPVWKMDEGVIQVNGYGDPIGNHRYSSPLAGRSPNFTAVPHKTYFGAIPDIEIQLSAVKMFRISLEGAPIEAEIHMTFDGAEVLPEEGFYHGTYGSYFVEAKAEGYRCFRNTYEIDDETEGPVTFALEMKELGDAWDGVSVSEPALNEDGEYEITLPAELAWFAQNVNAKGENQKAVLLNDIELGNFDWTPIGSSSSNPFTGTFKGNGHTVSEIYINEPKANYKALFGYIKDGSIEGLTVYGSISAKQYVGGVVAYAAGASTIDRCANYADVTGTSTYVGGVAGHLAAATVILTNCYNAGHVTGTTNCGGIVGNHNAATVMENIFNVGIVEGKTVGACVGGTTAKTNLANAFTTIEYHITDGQTFVSEEQMASGEVAFNLGDAFFQTIGKMSWPQFEGLKVFHDEETGEYYNLAVGFDLDLGEGSNDVEIKDGTLIMHVKDSYEISVVARPEKARLPKITWNSEKEEIVTVADGLLEAQSKGETTITATATFGEEIITVPVNVKVIGAVVTELTLDRNEIVLDMKENPSAVLALTFGPEEADEPEIIWTVQNEKIATVKPEGNLSATVSAVCDGETTVTVRHADNPDVYDVCQITVKGATFVDGLFNDIKDTVDIFDVTGRIVKLNADSDYFRILIPGIYLIKYGNEVRPFLIK